MGGKKPLSQAIFKLVGPKYRGNQRRIAGFSTLRNMLNRSHNTGKMDSQSADLPSSDSDSEESEGTESPRAKRRKGDDNADIILQLEKQYYNTTDQEGPEINGSLAKINSNFMKEKHDDKLNDLHKHYAHPKTVNYSQKQGLPLTHHWLRNILTTSKSTNQVQVDGI